MSFEFVLEVDDLHEDQADAVESMSQREGAWPLLPERRRKLLGLLGKRDGPPLLYVPAALDSDRHILTDDATWDAEAWDMEPSLRPLLARTIEILGDALPQGFVFRATWVGSEVREEVVISAEALADLVRASLLNEFAAYRVPSRRLNDG